MGREALIGWISDRFVMWGGPLAHAEQFAQAVIAKVDPLCVRKVGAQECVEHPGHTRTQEEKVAFRIAWDEAVKAGKEDS